MSEEVGRKTEVKRYYKADQDHEGAPIPGTEDKDIWIDMEIITKFSTEQGSGRTFKRRFWILNWENTNRTTKWTKIYKDKDADPDIFVVVPIPEKAYFESGSGENFRRFSLKFNNSEENGGRTVRIFRVFHAEYDSNGAVDVDRDDYLDVEVIKKYSEEGGSGEKFFREFWLPANEQIPLDGNTYKVDGEEWPAHREEQ